MGCCIHIHIELEINNKWEHYSCPNIKRDYDLFRLMGNTQRGNEDIKPIIEARGLPENLSVITKIDYYNMRCDAHHISWFGIKEIEKIFEYLEKENEKYWETWGYLFRNDYRDFKRYSESYPKEIQDMRFVFWYDN